MKKHIAKHADKESFQTYCGINHWNCSEDFWDDENSLVLESEASKGTCKTCNRLYQKYLKEYLEAVEAI
jgi:hypothetical protein